MKTPIGDTPLGVAIMDFVRDHPTARRDEDNTKASIIALCKEYHRAILSGELSEESADQYIRNRLSNYMSKRQQLVAVEKNTHDFQNSARSITLGCDIGQFDKHRILLQVGINQMGQRIVQQAFHSPSKHASGTSSVIAWHILSRLVNFPGSMRNLFFLYNTRTSAPFSDGDTPRNLYALHPQQGQLHIWPLYSEPCTQMYAECDYFLYPNPHQAPVPDARAKWDFVGYMGLLQLAVFLKNHDKTAALKNGLVGGSTPLFAPQIVYDIWETYDSITLHKNKAHLTTKKLDNNNAAMGEQEISVVEEVTEAKLQRLSTFPPPTRTLFPPETTSATKGRILNNAQRPGQDLPPHANTAEIKACAQTTDVLISDRAEQGATHLASVGYDAIWVTSCVSHDIANLTRDVFSNTVIALAQDLVDLFIMAPLNIPKRDNIRWNCWVWLHDDLIKGKENEFRELYPTLTPLVKLSYHVSRFVAVWLHTLNCTSQSSSFCIYSAAKCTYLLHDLFASPLVRVFTLLYRLFSLMSNFVYGQRAKIDECYGPTMALVDDILANVEKFQQLPYFITAERGDIYKIESEYFSFVGPYSIRIDYLINIISQCIGVDHSVLHDEKLLLNGQPLEIPVFTSQNKWVETYKYPLRYTFRTINYNKKAGKSEQNESEDEFADLLGVIGSGGNGGGGGHGDDDEQDGEDGEDYIASMFPQFKEEEPRSIRQSALAKFNNETMLDNDMLTPCYKLFLDFKKKRITTKKPIHHITIPCVLARINGISFLVLSKMLQSGNASCVLPADVQYYLEQGGHGIDVLIRTVATTLGKTVVLYHRWVRLATSFFLSCRVLRTHVGALGVDPVANCANNGPIVVSMHDSIQPYVDENMFRKEEVRERDSDYYSRAPCKIPHLPSSGYRHSTQCSDLYHKLPVLTFVTRKLQNAILSSAFIEREFATIAANYNFGASIDLCILQLCLAKNNACKKSNDDFSIMTSCRLIPSPYAQWSWLKARVADVKKQGQ